jgi:hypothetical protein
MPTETLHISLGGHHQDVVFGKPFILEFINQISTLLFTFCASQKRIDNQLLKKVYCCVVMITALVLSTV